MRFVFDSLLKWLGEHFVFNAGKFSLEKCLKEANAQKLALDKRNSRRFNFAANSISYSKVFLTINRYIS